MLFFVVPTPSPSSDLSPQQLSVLEVYRRMAEVSLPAPSYDVVKHCTGLSTALIHRLVNELADAGLLKPSHPSGRGRGNTYRLVTADPSQEAAA